MEYRVDIVNKFALFSNEDEDSVEDPIESLLKAAQASSAKSKADKENAKISSKNEKNVTKQTTGKSEKNVTRSSNTTANNNQTKTVISTQDQKTRPPRPGPNNRPPRFNSKRTNENENTQESNYNEPPTYAKETTERSFRGEEGRGRGGFRRGGRGGGGGGWGRGGNDDATAAAAAAVDGFGRKREFDRHSGSNKTGLKSTDKKDGAGSHNWGTVRDEVDEQLKPSVDGQEKENEPRSDEANDEDKLDDTTNEADEPTEMTLDEYKSLQEQARSKATFNIRKPGEGCADPKWKKMYVLKKKDEEEDEEEDNDENEEEKRKPKNVVPIAIRFNDAPQRRGGRGGPRGGRGGPSAAGGRGGGEGAGAGAGARPNQKAEVQAPNVADEQDFPSLS